MPSPTDGAAENLGTSAGKAGVFQFPVNNTHDPFPQRKSVISLSLIFLYVYAIV